MERRLRRALLAPLVLPHELAHALPAWLAGLDPTVSVLPAYEGRQTPLGQFDAALRRTTPLWRIRLIALAPLPVYLGLAAAMSSVLRADSLVRVVAFPLVSYWAALSGGDLAVAAAPDEARAAGAFVVSGSRWEELAAVLLTAATVLVVALLLL